jgi:hypothetical protein
MGGGNTGDRPALRTSPTGRIPQWVLDEAAGRPAASDHWRAWAPPVASPSRRRARLRTAFALVVLVALTVGAGMVTRPGLLPWTPSAAEPAFPHPTPGHEEADAPLGQPLAAPPGGGTYAFTAKQADAETPVAYDPCRPIHYVMRPDNAPVGAEAILHDAVDRVSAVTGLQFSYDGATNEQPARDREPYQPDRYGDRWAPVLVAWQTQEENPIFTTDVAGEAGSSRVAVDGPEVYVTGGVDLDAAAFEQLLMTPSGSAAARAIVLHELGHLVGLDHVTDTAELMYPTVSGTYDFASGDLTGLAALGRGECFPDL